MKLSMLKFTKNGTLYILELDSFAFKSAKTLTIFRAVARALIGGGGGGGIFIYSCYARRISSEISCF